MEPQQQSKKEKSVPNIKALLFDLDNTLYPASAPLNRAMHLLIIDYVAKHILKEEGYNPEDPEASRASALCDEYYGKYGLTINGLVTHYSDTVDVDHFLDYAHAPSKPAHLLTNLPKQQPSPGKQTLRDMLLSLRRDNGTEERQKLFKWIFTNSYRPHAERVLAHLGIEDCFDGIVDYLILRLGCKPHQEAYITMLNHVNRIHAQDDKNNNNDDGGREDDEEGTAVVRIKAEECLFFDDSLSNLKTAKTVGMYTVLVGHPPAATTSDGSGLPWYVDQAIADIQDLPSVLPFFGLACC
ncbi:putative suppressor of disruption of TFIIS [Balamuthia mandrillaris]